MDNKGTFGRAIATAVVWTAVAGLIALISIALAPQVGDDAIGAIFMVMIAAIVSNGFIWDWGRGSHVAKRDMQKRRDIEDDLYDRAVNGMQKRKREDIGARLSDFSDAELMDLRNRLQSGEIEEDELAYLLRR